DHVVSRATACTGQDGFHGPRRQIAPPSIRGAVHGQNVSTAGFCGKGHARRGLPMDGAFHNFSVFYKISRDNPCKGKRKSLHSDTLLRNFPRKASSDNCFMFVSSTRLFGGLSPVDSSSGLFFAWAFLAFSVLPAAPRAHQPPGGGFASMSALA